MLSLYKVYFHEKLRVNHEFRGSVTSAAPITQDFTPKPTMQATILCHEKTQVYLRGHKVARKDTRGF